MAKQPQTTILLAQPHRVARSDFDRAGAPLGSWVGQPPHTEELQDLVESALGLGPKAGRDVWVLSTLVWSHLLEMPAARTNSLSPAELRQALAFEAESLSGLAALSSTLAFMPAESPSGAAYWIVQTPSATLDVLQTLIRRGGSRLAGLGHPAALPRPITAADARPWQRLEQWPDITLAICADGPGPIQLQVLANALATPRLRLPATGRAEVLHDAAAGGAATGSATNAAPGAAANAAPDSAASAAADNSPGDGGIVNLAADSACGQFLKAWAEQLRSAPLNVAMAQPSRKPSLVKSRLLPAAALAVLALLACWAHDSWQHQRQSSLRQQLAAARAAPPPGQSSANVAQLEAELRTLRAAVDLARAERDAAAGRQALERQRHVALLRALARHAPGDVHIQQIDGDAQSATVIGLALDPRSAGQLAAALRRELPPAGWSVGQPLLKAQATLAGGGPWLFELPLRAVGPAGEPSAAVRPATAARGDP